MGDRLKNRVAIITGSGRGIGRGIAIAMAKEGARLIINDIISESAQATAEDIVELGGQAVPFICDVSDFEAAQRLTQTAADNFGRLDILVNNAGVVNPKNIWDMTEQDFDWVVGVSLKGTFNCTRHASVLMKEQGWGRIISASSSARSGVWGFSDYGAAKAGVAGFTATVALELGKYGVTCNAYCPGTKSEMTRVVGPHFRKMVEVGLMTEQQLELFLHHMPEPETVAPLIVYLCTDEASGITGQVFHILGGQIGIYQEAVLGKSFSKEQGLWTVEELIEQVPEVLLEGYRSPLASPEEWFQNNLSEGSD